MSYMTNIKTAVHLLVCSILVVLLVACGGQAESDALISNTQNQFYARSAQLASGQEGVQASAASLMATDGPAIAPIQAMEIPDGMPTNSGAQAP